LSVGSVGVFANKKPVVTKVAGFDFSSEDGPTEPVVIEVAAFESDFGPQVPGQRTTIPADRR
jgi:hypothetical protein